MKCRSHQGLAATLALTLLPACTGAAAATAISASALPPALPAPAQAGQDSIPLFLTTQINGRDMGLQPAQLRQGRLWMQRATLQGMGLKAGALAAQAAAPEGWVELGLLPDAQPLYDGATQSLQLGLPFSQLDWASTELSTATQNSAAASASRGLVLSYDLYGSQAMGQRSLSAATDLRAFQANAVFSNTMLSQYADGSGAANTGGGSGQSRNIRLDTSLSRSYPDSLLSLRVGDMVTAALPWTRATRLGGIQIGRNFGLQPYKVSTPIPALMGTSALPSDIALYIDGVRQYQGSVPSGPFTLHTPTGISGQGNAQVVLTDAFGRSTTLQYSFYGTSQLLAKGLSDWSAELGWARKNYGMQSFDYGSSPVAMGTWSYGLSDSFTLQSHGEASSGLANAGAGAVWRWGNAGVFSAAAAASQHGGSTGHQAQLGYNWNSSRYFVSMQATRASDNFRDAASLYDATRTTASGRAMVGYSHPALGSFNIGTLYLRNLDQAAQRYVTASWSRTFGGRGYVNLNLNHNLGERRSSSVQVLLSWYFDNQVNTGASVSHQDGRNTVNAYASKATPAEGGWGWSTSAQGSPASGSSAMAQARVDYRGDQLDANAAIAHSNRSTATAAGMSGSVVLMDGHAFASRRITDSFAVVSANGMPDVPVKRENIVVGHTDRDGMLLVPRLGAYRENRIAIDPMVLPAQMRVPSPEQTVTPTDRAGVMVRFELEAVRSATLILHDAAGAPLPMGATATIRNREDGQAAATPTAPGLVGYDGTTYFEQLPRHGLLTAILPNGSSCQTPVDWPGTPATDIPVIGPLICNASHP